MDFNVGLSLYLSSDYALNEKIIEKARDIGAKYIFTSLHIPEEKFDIKKVKELFKICAENKINLICDISPNTLKKFNFSSFDELLKYGINYIRLDYGFNLEEIVELSKKFTIVINSSTFSDNDYNTLKNLGMDFKNMIALHNFYPKAYTGLSIEKVKEINNRLHNFNIKVFSFVMGDKILRGPIAEGLPTVENQRNKNVLLNILELKSITDSDVVLIGDIDCEDKTYCQLKELNEGYISLKCEIDKEYEYLLDNVHHDRVDNSEYVIRSVESRSSITNKNIQPSNNLNRDVGALTISNNEYLRYAGELEICKKTLVADKRVNIIGKIDVEYIKYLNFIENGLGFKLFK